MNLDKQVNIDQVISETLKELLEKRENDKILIGLIKATRNQAMTCKQFQLVALLNHYIKELPYE